MASENLTTEQFDKIRAALKSAWPSANIMPDGPSIKFWYLRLRDIEYEVLEAAILELVETETFAPSIAQIREKCASYTNARLLEVGEAWGFVMKMVHKHGWPEEDEALAEMDELTRKAVRQVGGFLTICKSENIQSERARFVDFYSTELKRKRADIRTSPAVAMLRKKVIDGMQERMEQGGFIENTETYVAIEMSREEENGS